MKNDEKWLANYDGLKTYIEEHHHLLDKHKEENRGLLNFTNIPEGKSRRGCWMRRKRGSWRVC